MHLDNIKLRLSQNGWKDIGSGIYLGIGFDLVGSRRFLFTKWRVLVKTIPILDRDALLLWRSNFETISKKSKSLIWGSCFLLCLLAESVSDDLVREVHGDSFGFLGVLRLRGGGGNVLIADQKNHKVYGKVPALPYDVHAYSKGAKEILSQAVVQ